MPITATSALIVLRSPTTQDSATIALQGATVISYLTNARERLFTSTKSTLEGPAAVRGGIPICWPIFGPPVRNEDTKMKQHGFARISKWEFIQGESGDDAGREAVKAVFKLESTPSTLKLYPHDFTLTYTVTLLPTSLHVSLTVLAPTPISFQTLFHSYLRLPATILPPAVRVAPLEGLKFVDKVQSGAEGKEERSVVDVDGPKGEVDRVYFRAPDVLTVGYGAEGKAELIKSGLEDVVLWNPGPEKGATIGDMESDGANRYICLEPGQVGEFITLEAGKPWNGGVELKFQD